MGTERDEEILEWSRKGLDVRRIAEKTGISKSTVARRLKQLREQTGAPPVARGPKPGAVPPRAPRPQAVPTPPPATPPAAAPAPAVPPGPPPAAPSDPSDPAAILRDFEAELGALGGLTDPTELDIAELSALCRLLTRHLARMIGIVDWKAIRPLFEFRATLSDAITRNRPPERVDPARDPTNLGALEELRNRLDALRAPAELSAPVVEAVEAHAAALRARLGASAGAGAAA